MSVLITGGAGFIGSALAKFYFNSGENVSVVDNFFRGRRENLDGMEGERFNLYEIDLIDPTCVHDLVKILRAEQPHKIFHYAAVNGTEHFYDHPSLTQKTNSLATNYLIDAIDQVSDKDYRPLLIFASTSENYGDPKVVPTKEDDLTYVNIESVRDSYAVAKLNSEFSVKYSASEAGYDFLILRIFNVYGPNMIGGRYGQVIPEFIQRLAEGEWPLKILGTGKETRSFCYIDDHIALTDRLVKNTRSYNSVFNLGNPFEITIEDLANRIMTALGKDPIIEAGPARPFDTQRRCPDITKLIEVAGPFDFLPLEDGIRNLISYDERLAAFNNGTNA